MDKFLTDAHVQDYAVFFPALSSLISCFAQEILLLLGACASAVLLKKSSSCWELVRQLFW
jgi:hypothetical protein